MLKSWVRVVAVAAVWGAALACTCMPQHPQATFCNSDFVIVGRVQRVIKAKRDTDLNDVYKIRIRNTFKATPKAEVALRSGRLLTPAMESLCRLDLKPRETYIITGKVVQLEAHVNLCGYVMPWRKVTPRQRKGFRLLYKQGCTCKVNISFNQSWKRRAVSPNTCISGWDDCYERHGICLHGPTGRCAWTRAPRLTRCLQVQRLNGTII